MDNANRPTPTRFRVAEYVFTRASTLATLELVVTVPATISPEWRSVDVIEMSTIPGLALGERAGTGATLGVGAAIIGALGLGDGTGAAVIRAAVRVEGKPICCGRGEMSGIRTPTCTGAVATARGMLAVATPCGTVALATPCGPADVASCEPRSTAVCGLRPNQREAIAWTRWMNPGIPDDAAE